MDQSCYSTSFCVQEMSDIIPFLQSSLFLLFELNQLEQTLTYTWNVWSFVNALHSQMQTNPMTCLRLWLELIFADTRTRVMCNGQNQLWKVPSKYSCFVSEWHCGTIVWVKDVLWLHRGNEDKMATE